MRGLKIMTLFSILVVPPYAWAQSAEVTVTVASHQGSGCPVGETPSLWSFAGDRTLTTFSPSFISEAGPGVPLFWGRKTCTVDYQFTRTQPFRLRVLGTSSSSQVNVEAAPRLKYTARLLLDRTSTPTLTRLWTSADPSNGTWKDPALIVFNQPLVSSCGTSTKLKGFYTQELVPSRENETGESLVLHQLITYAIEDCAL